MCMFFFFCCICECLLRRTNIYNAFVNSPSSAAENFCGRHRLVHALMHDVFRCVCIGMFARVRWLIVLLDVGKGVG